MIDKDLIRRNLLKYTRKAFGALPKIDKPHILDIGCGSGVPTIEIANLSGGEVIGIDTDNTQLDTLRKIIKTEGLSERVQVLNRSMYDIDLPKESFDIVWAEGSIAFIGFKKGIKDWYKLIKSKGFLVVHDEIGDIEKKLQLISSSGYRLLNYFVLDKEVWWSEYFDPLKKCIEELKVKNPDCLKNSTTVKDAQKELDYFEQNPERCASVFLIMRKQ